MLSDPPGGLGGGRTVESPVRLLILAGFLILSAFLLFWNLGRYALWDDETMTALAAEGILQTGDTTAVHGRNLAAYRGGILLKDLHDRSTPPLASYLTAPSLRVFGESSGAARLPAALMGFALMVLAARWIWNSRISVSETLVWCLAILGNTSLILFLRQCRYYAPVILLSVLIVALYLRWKKGTPGLVLLSGLSFLLFAANYMDWLALSVCLLADYLLWKRKTAWLSLAQAAVFLSIQGILCGLLALRWNPLSTKFGSYVQAVPIWDRLTLFLWNLRDLNLAEFLVGGLILLAIPVALIRRDVWLGRGLLAIMLFVGVISLVSPQSVAITNVADIRYLVPLIPLGIAVGVRLLLLLLPASPIFLIVAAMLAFWTNLLNGTWMKEGVRSVPLAYIGELLNPNSEPYTPVIDWINANVRDGESIWVTPDYMRYPLMFHAPRAVYAWQLGPDQRSDPQFRTLPAIHFEGLQAPDYLIVFGPSVSGVRTMIRDAVRQGINYREVGRINTFWHDLYRPELFWRTFSPVLNYDPETQAIYIFKKS
jgi:hypothetical protein